MSTVARVACRALQPAVQRTGRARRRARPKLQSLPEPSKPVVTGSNIAGSGWQRAGRSPRQFQVILCGVLPAHAICAEAEEDDPTIAEASCARSCLRAVMTDHVRNWQRHRVPVRAGLSACTAVCTARLGRSSLHAESV